MRRNFLSTIALSLALTAVAFAQHEQHSSSDKAAKLMAGLSGLHHPVSTKDPEAQKFFDQGLALIYAFNHEEARRSFEQAARLDPKLAMAQWGIALAVGPNYNEPQIDPARLSAARRALEKANEPPGWYYPVRESLGAALLMAGDAVEAESVFRKNLEDNPRNGRSLFGLAESLKRRGKTQDERRARAEFEKAWKNADVKLKIEDL